MKRLSSAAITMLLVALPSLASADLESRRTPIVRAVETFAPVTVNITSTQVVHRPIGRFNRGDPLFRDFFRQFRNQSQTAESLGTGVLIHSGYVLTNEHVLAGSTQILVTLGDGREFEAELVGGDPATDLAVARLKTDEHTPAAKVGDSDDLMIGETVIAIGNAFGLKHTVTTGVLSAVNRSITTDGREYHGFLQTDASINPGNSGGPLVNLDGELIGINTAILGRAEGIGFAIPIKRALRIVDDLIFYGEVVPTWLGLRLQELTPALRNAMQTERTDDGVLVSYVFANSPADRAGVRSGDILLDLDGTKLRELRNYFEVLRGITAGDKASLSLERADQTIKVSVEAEPFPEERAEELGEILLGIEVTDMSDALAQRHRIAPNRGGLMISRVIPRGPAATRGLLPGDVILKVNQEATLDRVAFRKAITKLRGQGRALLFVQRGALHYPVILELS